VEVLEELAVAGGGGAGGLENLQELQVHSKSISRVSALPVSVQGYPITVGAGGTGQVLLLCRSTWYKFNIFNNNINWWW
jgi:hypothetical protein